MEQPLPCICGGPSTHPCGPTCNYPYTDENRLRTPQYTEAYVVGLERQLAEAQGKLDAVRAWRHDHFHSQIAAELDAILNVIKEEATLEKGA